MRLAYSYLRFSSPQQAAGDSLRRQADGRETWLAARPGVRLDTSLVLEDKGRSAFKRQNWDTYALARFVEHVKSGRVEPGSYLLVENLDRLSREDAGEAVQLFLTIVNAGVVVVQLSPVVMEFKRPVEAFALMYAIMELSRGHSESAIKSERCRAAWARKNKEAGARPVTRRLPGWVRLAESGRRVLDPGGAAAVRRMFALARAGHSALGIARLFNAEGVPVLGRTVVKGRAVAWSAPTVYQILVSRATVGEYVPYRTTKRADKPAGEPVPGYYPPVVDEETFHAARAALAVRGQVGRGRGGKHVNLFAGLLKDARDGGALSYSHKAGQCDLIPVGAAHGGKTRWVSFPAAVFETAVLDRLAEVTAADVQGEAGDPERKVEALAGRHAEAAAKVAFYRAKCDESEDAHAVFADTAVEWERKRKELAAEVAEAQRDAASPLAEGWGEFRSLAALLAADPSDELRVRVRAALRRAVEGVHCLIVARGRSKLAAVRVQFRGGRHRDYAIEYTPGRSNQNVKRPGRYEARDLALPPGRDLRDPTAAAELEKLLAAAELGTAGD